jgi:hypothetical protein
MRARQGGKRSGHWNKQPEAEVSGVAEGEGKVEAALSKAGSIER